MFFTYVFRELRRRHRQALLTALGLAVGVALVVAVTAYADGVGKAQDQVLQSLYGVGTDITVLAAAEDGPERPAALRHAAAGRVQAGPEVQPLRGHDAAPGQQSISDEEARADRRRWTASSAATGSITMNVMSVEGKFAQVQGGAAGASGSRAVSPPSGASSSSQQGQAQMAPIDVSSFSVSGVDTTDLDLGPAELGAGQLRALADQRRRERQGRPGRPRPTPSRTRCQGRRHEEDRRQEVRHRRRRRRCPPAAPRPTCTSPSAGRRSSATTRARSTRST